MRAILLLLTWISLLSGCVTISNVKPGAGLQLRSGEAIAVIGMRQRYRVHLQSGKVADGAWHMRFANPEANVYPENGYIVVKLPVLAEGRSYSIPMVLPEGIGLRGAIYIPCPGTTAPTFTVKPGMVNYVGDLSYKLDHNGPSFETTSDVEAARKYLEATYPELAASLQSSQIVPMKVLGTNCNPSFSVPIFVPG